MHDSSLFQGTHDSALVVKLTLKCPKSGSTELLHRPPAQFTHHEKPESLRVQYLGSTYFPYIAKVISG